MNSYLLCLRNSSEPSCGEEEIIINAAKEAGVCKENSETLFSPKEFFDKVSGLIEEKELLILAVDTFSYMKTRRVFLSGLSLETEVSEEILKLTPENYYLRELHASIPKGAAPLPTMDGLYSGFIFKRGMCTVAFIPLDKEKTADVTGDIFKGYIGKLQGENGEPVKKEGLPAESDSAAVPEPAPVSEEASETVKQGVMPENELSEAIAETCEALNKAGITAAVSLTPSAQKILGDCSETENLVFLPASLKETEFPLKTTRRSLQRKRLKNRALL